MSVVRFRPEPPFSLGTYSGNALQPKTCCAARQRSLSVDFRRTCFPCLLGNRAWLPLSTDQHHSRNRQRLGPIRIGILGPSNFWRWIGVNDLLLKFRKARKQILPLALCLVGVIIVMWKSECKRFSINFSLCNNSCFN